MAENPPDQPSLRYRDKFSRLKDRVKDKVRDKVSRHNLTDLIHHNISQSTDEPSRHGFRDQMHRYKEAFKNKTNYEGIKDRLKDKIDEKIDGHYNQTYPKGFYDSLFSPETENDVYLQTALICLAVIALLCVIPTLIIVFLPSKGKKTRSAESIFFHIFLCELLYLSYVFLAMINVWSDFHLVSFLCDFANYGMYVTIPIMQIALLFLSLERLSQHLNLPTICANIFLKSYLIQVILWSIWVILVALMVTVTLIRKHFSFSHIRDHAMNIAPPIVGDVLGRLATRRYHCSIDGRISSAYKIVLIVLFVILVVKPIVLSLGSGLLTPCCCRRPGKSVQRRGERRTTILAAIILLLNFSLSFPFYFISMFNSILTRIDATKDVFGLVLKISFVLRITNIIFECLAFYIFERNSWHCISKCFYLVTCKKFAIFNAEPDDDVMFTNDPDVQDLIDKTRQPNYRDDDDYLPEKKQPNKKQQKKKPVYIDEDDDDDDGGMRPPPRKQARPKPRESDDEDDQEKERRRSKKNNVVNEEEKRPRSSKTQRKPSKKDQNDDNDDDDEEEEVEKKPRTKSGKSPSRAPLAASDHDDDNDDEEEEEEEKPATPKQPKKASVKRQKNDDDEVEQPPKVPRSREKRKRQSHPTEVQTRVTNGKTSSSTPRHSVPNNIKRRSTPPPAQEPDSDGASSRASHRSVSPRPAPAQRSSPSHEPNSHHRSRPKSSAQSPHGRRKKRHNRKRMSEV